jgi:DNA-binding LytR/AlgR family response regulator
MVLKCIPVIHRRDNSLHWLNTEEICYISMDERVIAYHTKEDVFYSLSKLEDVIHFFNPKGYEKVDRGNVANLAAVTYFDSTHGKIYFDETIASDTKYATLSPVYLKRLRQLLGRDKEIISKEWYQL